MLALRRRRIFVNFCTPRSFQRGDLGFPDIMYVCMYVYIYNAYTHLTFGLSRVESADDSDLDACDTDNLRI